ncbi:chymotrypsin inhibitor-like [Argiope bruennichi]|uniref:chymotrypsin inhibitor-like n=1 Tax=Argiope bruennichi TaxID=94029 RepID=UPI002494000B|nr:chymotrypsin inhibitor-like [Argiope bruennichi]
MKFFCIALLLLPVLYMSEEQQCGGNSHYNGCGSSCPITCGNRENPPRYSVMMCRSGCQCDESYVEKENGSCVLPENCPRKGN